jgi:formylglycine-generating enzyme required for sulfatase activity
MPYDVFISFAEKDKKIAEEIRAKFEDEAGLSCWIAPRDIKPGQEWAEAIVEGVSQAQAMVLVLSKHANNSEHVVREVAQAVSHKIPILPFRIQSFEPSGQLAYYIDPVQRMDSFLPPRDADIDQLLLWHSHNQKPPPLQIWKRWPLLIAIGCVVAVILGGIFITKYGNVVLPGIEAGQEIDAGQASITPTETERVAANDVPPMAVIATASPTTGTVTPDIPQTPTTILTATLSFTPTVKTTLTATSTPKPGVGSMMVSERDGMTLVYVPEGAFWMGAHPDDTYADDDEHPYHEIYLDAFWIDQTEVTNGMYARCVADQACGLPVNLSSTTHLSYYVEQAFKDHPVINVSWQQAVDYCAWAGRRLPTEAEWEKAARGSEGLIYPWGNELNDCTQANYSILVQRKCVGDAKRVGSFPDYASPYNALDMVGNVWEFVADFYSTSYYSSSPWENPQGPISGLNRVVKGGSWDNIPADSRSSERFSTTNYGDMETGFRCAVSAE